MSVWLALDGYVVTPTGPILIPELTVGSSVFAIAGGNATEANVSKVSDVIGTDVFRLLTPVGDIVVPSDEILITRKGPLQASAIAADVQHGREPRLEVMNPATLLTKPLKQSEDHTIESFLRSLDPPVVQLPTPIAKDGLASKLDSMLRGAGVQFKRVQDDRWIAFVIENVPSTLSKNSRNNMADALLMLTAWGWEGNSLISRTRLGATEARRRVIASLVQEEEQYEARWTPRYRPVECRIHHLEEGRMPPFAPVSTALPEHGRTVRVTMTQPGGLVVGLAVSGPVA